MLQADVVMKSRNHASFLRVAKWCVGNPAVMIAMAITMCLVVWLVIDASMDARRNRNQRVLSAWREVNKAYLSEIYDTVAEYCHEQDTDKPRHLMSLVQDGLLSTEIITDQHVEISMNDALLAASHDSDQWNHLGGLMFLNDMYFQSLVDIPVGFTCGADPVRGVWRVVIFGDRRIEIVDDFERRMSDWNEQLARRGLPSIRPSMFNVAEEGKP